MGQDIDQQVNILSIQEYNEIIHRYLGSKEFLLLHHDISQIHNVSGFLGDYYKIEFTYIHKDKETTLKLFAKSIPHNKNALQSMASVTFRKEVFIYNEYFDFIRSKGFGNILDFTAKCYFTKNNEIVILEDLCAKGYQTINDLEPANFDLMSNIVRQLAKFHACSLLLEESESERTGKLYRIADVFEDYLEETGFPNKGYTSRVHRCGARTVSDYIIDKFPDIANTITIEEFKERVTIAMENMFEKNLLPSKSHRNVLCHGDAWISNVLMKKDNENKSLSCLLIDFQLVRYCPPILDLIMTLYTGTNRDFRIKYQTELFEFYYKELSTILSKYGRDIDNIISYKAFLKSFEEYKIIGLCQALCYAHVTLLPKVTLKKMLTDKERSEHFIIENRSTYYEEENVWDDDDYCSRMRELIEEMYKACENKDFAKILSG